MSAPFLAAYDSPTEGESGIGAARSPATPVVVLSRDAALLEALAQATVGRAQVILVSTAEQLRTKLMLNAGAVIVVDAASAPEPVHEFIGDLALHTAGSALLVAGTGHQHTLLATHIADGDQYRFVHKPASSRRLALFLDAAARQRDLSQEELSATATHRLLTLNEDMQRSSSVGRYAVLGALTLIAVAAWYMHRASVTRGSDIAAVDSIASNAAAPAANPPAAPSSDPALTELLQRADRALVDARLVASDGSGAGDLYRLALARAPTDARASQGLAAVVEQLLRQAERASTAARQDEAAQDIEAARRLQPDSARAASAAAQLEQLREAALQEQLRHLASGAKSDQASVYVQLARKRINSGALIDPSEDSALTYLSAATALAPAAPAVQELSVQLTQQMIAATRSAIATDDVSTASRLLMACRDLQVSASVLQALSQALDQLRSNAPAASAAEPLVNGAAAAPSATVSAVALPSATASAVSASSGAPVAVAPASTNDSSGTATAMADNAVITDSALRRTQFVAPVFPRLAQSENIQGWVELEFTLTTMGTVSDIKVVAAQPARMFDAAATNAVAQWHYEPVLRNGVAVEKHVHVRIRFQL